MLSPVTRSRSSGSRTRITVVGDDVTGNISVNTDNINLWTTSFINTDLQPVTTVPASSMSKLDWSKFNEDQGTTD